jgi:L-seryl-tRNA(Ser) seleniumtransferase
MRPDKVTLAALAATLGLYNAGLATTQIPVWRMIAAPVATLEARARALVAELPGATAVPMEATVGGGSLPGQTLPSWGLSLAGGSADRLLARLRRGEPAIVGRIEDGAVRLDLRTVDAADDERLAAAVARALHGAPPLAGAP